MAHALSDDDEGVCLTYELNENDSMRACVAFCRHLRDLTDANAKRMIAAALQKDSDEERNFKRCHLAAGLAVAFLDDKFEQRGVSPYVWDSPASMKELVIESIKRGAFMRSDAACQVIRRLRTVFHRTAVKTLEEAVDVFFTMANNSELTQSGHRMYWASHERDDVHVPAGKYYRNIVLSTRQDVDVGSLVWAVISAVVTLYRIEMCGGDTTVAEKLAAHMDWQFMHCKTGFAKPEEQMKDADYVCRTLRAFEIPQEYLFEKLPLLRRTRARAYQLIEDEKEMAIIRRIRDMNPDEDRRLEKYNRHIRHMVKKYGYEDKNGLGGLDWGEDTDEWSMDEEDEDERRKAKKKKKTLVERQGTK